jgi:CRP-like cAMP-binding protein
VAFYSDSGKDVIFPELRPGRMFGELSAIDCQQRSAHGHALNDTAVVVLSSEIFCAVTPDHPVVAGRVMPVQAVQGVRSLESSFQGI